MKLIDVPNFNYHTCNVHAIISTVFMLFEVPFWRVRVVVPFAPSHVTLNALPAVIPCIVGLVNCSPVVAEVFVPEANIVN